MRQRQWSVNELARETSVKAGEIGEDLRHLQLSLKRQREVFRGKDDQALALPRVQANPIAGAAGVDRGQRGLMAMVEFRKTRMLRA
ncbi:MAG: hypothetical protein ACKVHO_23845 [Verrucomicrobiia bacterium]